MKYQVTYPATQEQIARNVAFEGEIKGIAFNTREEAEAFAAVTVGAEVEELDRITAALFT